jgi:hypothetical protein
MILKAVKQQMRYDARIIAAIIIILSFSITLKTEAAKKRLQSSL